MRAQSLCSLLFVTEAPSKVQLRSQLPWEGFAICSIDEATAIILFLLIYQLIVNCLVAYLSAIIKVWLSHLFNSRLWSIWLYCELWRAKTSPSMVLNSARWQSSEDRLSCMVVTVAQLLSCVRLFATPWTAARQASLSFTVSWNFLKLISIELVILCGGTSRRWLCLWYRLHTGFLFQRGEGRLPPPTELTTT